MKQTNINIITSGDRSSHSHSHSNSAPIQILNDRIIYGSAVCLENNSQRALWPVLK